MKFFSFLFAISLFASPCPPNTKSACKQYECSQAKLYPAATCLDTPCDPSGMFFVFDVSLLAWKGIVDGLDFTLKSKTPLSPNLNVDGHFIAPDFSWEPALKINFAMIFPKRAWDSQFRWTYFKSESSKTVHSQALYPIWVFPNADMASQFVYSYAKGSLNLKYNGVDIELGYAPFLTPSLSFRFLAGLKVAHIFQKFHVLYKDGFTDADASLIQAAASLNNKTIGAGPRLGFHSKWLLGKGFSLLSTIAGSLPLWHYRMNRIDIDQNIQDGTLKNIDASYRYRFWTFRSILETSLGFGWESCFGCRSQYPFGIQASYEFQYFPEQNMMPKLVNAGLLSQAFMPRGDLIFHGATFTLQFGY